jgi:hypothetical protein
MHGLGLKMRLYNTFGFPSFIDDVCYAVVLLHCGVSLPESKLMVWDPGLRVQILIDYFSVQALLVLLKMSVVS